MFFYLNMNSVFNNAAVKAAEYSRDIQHNIYMYKQHVMFVERK